MAAEHPTSVLDDVVHQRARLGILALLNGPQRCDFALLRDELGLTDGNLNRHLAVLAEAGYVSLSKAMSGGRPRTWVTATKAGKRAFRAEVEALRRIVALADSDEPPE